MLYISANGSLAVASAATTGSSGGTGSADAGGSAEWSISMSLRLLLVIFVVEPEKLSIFPPRLLELPPIWLLYDVYDGPGSALLVGELFSQYSYARTCFCSVVRTLCWFS